MNNRLINTKVAGGGGGCTDIVDNYDPFGGNGVALYQLNGDATDSSPNAYNGTWSGTESYGTGVFGQAGVFNGSTSKITLTASATTPIDLSTDNFTISFWIKGTTNASYGALISKYGSSNPNRSLYSYRNTNGTIVYGLISTTDVFNAVTSNGVNPINQWTHVVFVRNSNTQSIYLNGAFDNSISNTTTTKAIAQPLLVGDTDDTVADEFFEGSIDQIRFFNTALTPLEVEALYTEELCICDGTVDTLDILGDGSCIATYQLDGNANDLSGNYSGTPTDVSYGVGEFDLAGVFNGSSSKVDISSLSIPLNNFSYSLWFKANDTSSYQILILHENGGRSYGVQLNNDANIGSYMLNSSAGTEYLLSNSITIDTNWHNVVITKSSTQGHKIYYDGNNIATDAAFTGNLLSGNFSNFLGSSGTSGYFNGSIDQVRIFNKALSAGEVTTLYNESACTKAACTGTTNTLDILGDGSCVAAYPLDGSPADLSGNHNGLIVGTPSFPPNGKFDQSLIPSETSYVSVPPSIYNGSTATSISLWFKSNGLNYNAPFWATKSAGVGGGWKIRTSLSGTGLSYAFSRPNDTDIFLSTEISTPNLNDGNWHHVVATWDGTTSSGGAKLYLDNSLISSLTAGTNYITGYLNDNYIGLDLQSPGRAVTNGVDQVRFFNKALSAGEVTTLYNETPCN